MVPKNIGETLINISSILNNLKSFMKQVYQNHWTQNINNKKDQNNYFRAEISKKEQQVLRLKVNKKIDF